MIGSFFVLPKVVKKSIFYALPHPKIKRVTPLEVTLSHNFKGLTG